MVGRGLPVVPPLVCTFSGSRLSRSRTSPWMRPNGGFSCWSFLMSSESNVGSLHDVVDATDVARLEPGRLPAAAVELVLPAGLHQVEELLVLERARSRRPTTASAWPRTRRAADSAGRRRPSRRTGDRSAATDCGRIDDVHLTGSPCAPRWRRSHASCARRFVVTSCSRGTRGRACASSDCQVTLLKGASPSVMMPACCERDVEHGLRRYVGLDPAGERVELHLAGAVEQERQHVGLVDRAPPQHEAVPLLQHDLPVARNSWRAARLPPASTPGPRSRGSRSGRATGRTGCRGSGPAPASQPRCPPWCACGTRIARPEGVVDALVERVRELVRDLVARDHVVAVLRRACGSSRRVTSSNSMCAGCISR